MPPLPIFPYPPEEIQLSMWRFTHPEWFDDDGNFICPVINSTSPASPEPTPSPVLWSARGLPRK